MGIRILVGVVAAAVALAAGAAATAAGAAGPLNPPVPLPARSTGLSAGNVAASLAAAQRAQELGVPTVAIGLYRQLLSAPAPEDRPNLTLALATALLDAGRAAEAEKVLAGVPEPHGPEWRLRFALAAAQQKRFDVARSEAGEINVDHLTRPDRAWFWFLRGVLADTAAPRDTAGANEFYLKAQQEAPSDMARATFLAAGLRVRLRLVNYTAAEIEQARRLYETYQERAGTQSYQFAEDYAVMRDAAGAKGEAVRFLSELLVRIPRTEHAWTDRLRRLLGMIGDRGRSGAGRHALNQLLETGAVADMQRQALQLLAQDSQHEPERGLFRAELDKLIAMMPRPAILDSVMLIRAQLALEDSPNDYAMAERCANELKDKFPGSPLRPHAFVVLASSAWEQRRFRVAADNARQAREILAASSAASAPTEAKVVAQAVAELRVLEAEARFRAQDFQLAADAYAAVLSHPPAGVLPGDLIFQRALAEIRAGADDPARDLTGVVDALAADPRFDAVNRWEAEWSLARALRVRRQTKQALARVTRLLESPEAGAVSAELRARMGWLQAQLSFDAGQPELTLALVDQLDGATAGVAPALRTEVASTAALLEARAQFDLGREAAALETLGRLRTEFAQTEAAVYSYLVAAAYYAEPGRDKLQDAQRSLRSLIDKPEYQQSEYVPYALFQLALLSERLGQEKDFRDANAHVEELVRPDRDPPAPPELVFAARLKQGDLFRTLNDFPRAQVAYEDLVNNPKYAQRPDVVVAKLRLAECHNARSSTDPSGSHADLAQSMFEELLYRVTAPADVRIEAGYNLGKLLERRGQLDKARDVWWRDVIAPFLVDAPEAPPPGAKRPYWLARTLLDLGALLVQRGALDDARRVYGMLRDGKLGYGEAIAIERLQQLGVGGAPAAGKP